MRRLFAAPEPVPDARAALFAVVSLMLMLLPFILLSSSPMRLAQLDLSIASGTELPPHSGPVEDLVLRIHPDRTELVTTTRVADVTAEVGNSITQTVDVPHDAKGRVLVDSLHAALRRVRGLDPGRSRIRLEPSADVPAQRVVAMVDLVRSDSRGTLFEDVVLGGIP